MNEKFAVKQDPSNSSNWGIIWETGGTEGGFTSEDAARRAAVGQGGAEADPDESATWEW
jgi:hypothetical protein